MGITIGFDYWDILGYVPQDRTWIDVLQKYFKQAKGTQMLLVIMDNNKQNKEAYSTTTYIPYIA